MNWFFADPIAGPSASSLYRMSRSHEVNSLRLPENFAGSGMVGLFCDGAGGVGCYVGEGSPRWFDASCWGGILRVDDCGVLPPGVTLRWAKRVSISAKR